MRGRGLGGVGGKRWRCHIASRGNDKPGVTLVEKVAHRCFLRDGAGGLIDAGWCSMAFEPVLRGLPTDLSPDDVTREELLLFRDRAISVYFCPFDYLNTRARVILVGLTPGRAQAHLALRTTTTQLARGSDIESALAAADAKAASPARCGRTS